MFGIKNKKDKYRKISVSNQNDFNILCDFIESHTKGTVYITYENPLKFKFKELEKDILEQNADIYFVNKYLFVGYRRFDLENPYKNNEIQVYLGDILVIKLLGIKDEFIYYCIDFE